MDARRSRMLEGARNYAAADRSDPFAFARCMCHIDNGVASVTQNADDAIYSADPYQEERFLPNGQSYSVTVYRSIRRP